MCELKKLFKLLLQGLIILPLIIAGCLAVLFLFCAYYKYLAAPGVELLLSYAPSEASYENASLIQLLLNVGKACILLGFGIILNWPLILFLKCFRYSQVIVVVR